MSFKTKVKRCVVGMVAVMMLLGAGCDGRSASSTQSTNTASLKTKHVVDLTPEAAREFKKQLSSSGLSEGAYLRVAVHKSGDDTCAFTYALDITEDVDPDHDWYSESEGVRILVDAASEPYLNGATIDYLVSEEGKGFSFDNPNAEKAE